MVKQWNGLPKEAVESLSFEIFKNRLDQHLAGMVQTGMTFSRQFRKMLCDLNAEG